MSGWTEEVVATARRFFDQGMSFSIIAEQLCRAHGLRVTRNAMIGKARRLGWPKREGPPLVSKPRTVCRGMVSLPPPPPREIPIPTRAHACTLLDLHNTSCRWPIWSDDAPPAEQFYCGMPSANLAEGRSYCAYHTGVAHAPRRGPRDISEIERMRMRKEGRRVFNGSVNAPEMMQAAE